MHFFLADVTAFGYSNDSQVHVPTDSKTGSCKGIAYVQFEDLEAAPRALSELDGKPFQGRLLHILPAAPKRENALDEYAISKLPLKKQQQIKRRAEAATASFKWNSLYMNADAVMASAAHRLGVSKSDILDPTSSDAAIKQAHAEINIIQETKKYFAANGVNLDSFKRRECSDTAILVKNFPFGTSPVELRKLFEAHGPVTKLLLPPAGTIAIVEFELPSQARAAFKGLAYRKIKDSVLFLEKAPKILFASRHNADNETTSHKMSTTDLLEPIEDETIPSVTYTLFVSNLNFSTTTAVVRDLFKPLSGFLSAQVKTKTDVKKPGQLLSMGFGFIEFRTKQDSASALKMMNGYELDGHKLQIKESHRALDAAEERRKEDLAKKLSARRSKLMVKNLPFEATKKDVRALFSPYGQLKSVRLPVKVGSMSTRGFAFADFVSAREAKNAMDTLQGTHLLGRRLNLEFAAEDAVDPEDVIEKMTKRAENQADKVALQKLASTGRRKKFIVQRDELDDN